MEQQQQQPQIPWEKTTAIKCEKEGCGSETFEQVVLRRSLSKFVSGFPEDVELNAPVIRCTECKTIPAKFLAPFKQVKDVTVTPTSDDKPE